MWVKHAARLKSAEQLTKKCPHDRATQGVRRPQTHPVCARERAQGRFMTLRSHSMLCSSCVCVLCCSVRCCSAGTALQRQHRPLGRASVPRHTVLQTKKQQRTKLCVKNAPRSQNCAKRRENNEIYTFAPACTAVLQYCNTRTDVTWAMGGAGGVALAICAPAHASCTPHECVMYHQLRTVLRSCARSCVRTVLHARGLACAWSCVHVRACPRCMRTVFVLRASFCSTAHQHRRRPVLTLTMQWNNRPDRCIVFLCRCSSVDSCLERTAITSRQAAVNCLLRAGLRCIRACAFDSTPTVGHQRKINSQVELEPEMTSEGVNMSKLPT